MFNVLSGLIILAVIIAFFIATGLVIGLLGIIGISVFFALSIVVVVGCLMLLPLLLPLIFLGGLPISWLLAIIVAISLALVLLR